MKNYYDAGERVRVRVTFTVDGIVQNPSTVNFLWAFTPNGGITGTDTTLVYDVDAEVIRESTGLYYVDFDMTEDNGTYHFRWEAEGDVVGAAEAKVRTRESVFV